MSVCVYVYACMISCHLVEPIHAIASVVKEARHRMLDVAAPASRIGSPKASHDRPERDHHVAIAGTGNGGVVNECILHLVHIQTQGTIILRYDICVCGNIIRTHSWG